MATLRLHNYAARCLLLHALFACITISSAVDALGSRSVLVSLHQDCFCRLCYTPSPPPRSVLFRSYSCSQKCDGADVHYELFATFGSFNIVNREVLQHTPAVAFDYLSRAALGG